MSLINYKGVVFMKNNKSKKVTKLEFMVAKVVCGFIFMSYDIMTFIDEKSKDNKKD